MNGNTEAAISAKTYVESFTSAPNYDTIQSSERQLPMNLQYFAKIPEEKFTKYALDPVRQPDKAEAFRKALGYTIDNSKELIEKVNEMFDPDKLLSRGANEYGDKFEQIMEITGPNGKTAYIKTGWIRYFGDAEYCMTSAYITKKGR